MDKLVEQALLKEWAPTLDVKGRGVKPLADVTDRRNTATILENTNKWLNEDNGTQTADLGTFRPIILPVTRRIAPNLLANQVVGVQPMSGPTGQAFAWRVGYAGTNEANRGVTNPLSKIDRGALDGSGHTAYQVVLVFAAGGDADTYLPGDTLDDTSGAGGNVHGTVIYVESTNNLRKVLVDYVVSGTAIAFPITTGDSVYVATGSATNGAVADVTEDVINNEQLFNLILTNYTGPYTTSAGEALAEDMPTIKATLEQVTVTAKTRKLKAEYSIEMAQDLKAVHNIDAEGELMNSLQSEIAAEIDRELVDAMVNNATSTATWNYGDVGAPVGQSTTTVAGDTAGIQTAGVADGRDEIMKFRTLYTKIVKEANQIARTTRKGPGNFIIVSTNVLTALQALNNFVYNPVPNDIGELSSFTNAGTLDGRYAVYVDTLNWGADYALVGYKGPSAFDTGVIYCPYVPVMLQKTVHEQSFQPVIGAMTRSAIAYNLNGTANFYRKFNIDLTYSQLG